MNKSAIQKFAIWARRELISRVSQKAFSYGVREDGIDAESISIDGRLLSATEINERRALVAEINGKGYQQVMEEVAYTWFNRFCALRFMEVNGYLPCRVFSDEDNAFKPQIMTEAIHLDMDGLDMAKVYAYLEADQKDELYKYLLITQCNALNAPLPGMFQKINDHTELLFPDNLLREGSVIEQMVTLVPEEDWKDAIQIVGWLYQYYNSEPKDKVFADLKKNTKISKNNIPAATQLFTPDWIVRYMVENSLGRLWLEGHPNEELRAGWKYYLDEAEQEPDVQTRLEEIRAEYRKLEPQDIKVIDPCMGSGHILAYMFDVLMQIYLDYGYTSRDAVRSILKNNLYGLDIDDRAGQLAYFAVMMKAQSYDRNFLRRTDNPTPHVFAIQESNNIRRRHLDFMGGSMDDFSKNNAKNQLKDLLDTLIDAKEYGSILNIEPCDWNLLRRFVSDTQFEADQYSFETDGIEQTSFTLLELISISQAMAQKYDAVVTNPPYAGAKGLNNKLTDLIQTLYPEGKGDLFAPFISRVHKYLNRGGLAGMITPTAWLYNPSYAQFRNKQIKQISIVTLSEMGSDAFEVGFGTTAFVFTRKDRCGSYRGVYMDIKDSVTTDGYFGKLQQEKNYISVVDDYLDYEGCKFCYKLTPVFRRILLESPPLGSIGSPRAGLQTDDNNRFIREWHEVDYTNIDFHHRKGDTFGDETWFPHIKGGTYRKWYGNLSSVVNWRNDGEEIKENASRKFGSYTKRVQSQEFYFTQGIAWTHTTYSQPFACRYLYEGVISNVEGPAIFGLGEKMLLVLAMLNTKVMDAIYMRMSDSIHYLAGELAKFPIILKDDEYIKKLAEKNVALSKAEWDSFETSWDFKQHPLVAAISKGSVWFERGSIHLSESYQIWEAESSERFAQIKANEEALNRIFIDIYGLQNELTPEVEDKDVTVSKADLGRDIRSLLSYAVGCMFGRYSLDVEGLAYAGGDWDVSKYKSWIPDEDNVIPICDDEYMDDDITGRFVKWIETVYGSDTLEENLKFIANALGGKGTPREIIRNYFINDFYTDHLKVYQKRPIYWLFDSGKKNGFKALIYMHRYQEDLLARIRTDYVHEMQERYRTMISQTERTLVTAAGSNRVALNRTLDKLRAQLDEISVYEEKVAHLADKRISIDLDDGVKHNYALFQDVLAKIK